MLGDERAQALINIMDGCLRYHSGREDYRGMNKLLEDSLAAIRELGIHSPLCEAGLGKSEIRNLSQDLLLPTWNKPSMACLASRFVYGETITKDQLKMVERAEELLHLLGFRQYRVRIHGGSLARIEVEPEEIHLLLPLRGQIHTAFRQLGFSFVTVDLGGYRTGSMNEAIRIQ
jgi:uncharacterized protein